MTPADATGLQEFHERLSGRSVYLRYLAPKPRLSDSEALRLTTVDHGDREAYVAMAGEQIIAIGRYERLPQGRAGAGAQAEVAFVVQDEYQGQGIGSALLALLAEAARSRGIDQFVAEVSPENGRMLACFRHWPGGCALSHASGSVHAVLDLAPAGAMARPDGSSEEQQ